MKSKIFYMTMINVLRRNMGRLREEYEYLCDHLDSMSEEEAHNSMVDILEKTGRIENRLRAYEAELQHG